LVNQKGPGEGKERRGEHTPLDGGGPRRRGVKTRKAVGGYGDGATYAKSLTEKCHRCLAGKKNLGNAENRSGAGTDRGGRTTHIEGGYMQELPGTTTQDDTRVEGLSA